jgi:hypothetical protein
MFGDFLGFHPHLNTLVSDGCFYKNGVFIVYPDIINLLQLKKQTMLH